MKNDRFLVGILIFIGLLVVTALVLFATGNSQQVYLPEDNPEAIVHNYTLALSNGDYARAYGYLADKKDKPAEVDFRSFFSQYDPLQNVGLRVGSSDILQDQAVVDVTIVYGSTGPFDTGFDRPDLAILVLEGGDWKLISMPYPYWDFGWFGEVTRP